MGDVVSFRPSDEESDLLARTQRRFGLKTRAEAIRHLLREAGKRARPLSDDPVLKFRVPKEFRGGRSQSSRELDAELYGDRP